MALKKSKRTRTNRNKVGAAEQAARREVPAVGGVLRRAREHRGLALREVGRRIGRSSAYLSQIERGLIRQPDPVVLLELADLYRLDFLTLANWAGWMDESQAHPDHSSSATFLVRRILELNDTQRAEIFNYIERLLHEQRT